jgi:hypothetical protein
MAEFTFDRPVEVTGTAESIWQLIADVPRLVTRHRVSIEPLRRAWWGAKVPRQELLSALRPR